MRRLIALLIILISGLQHRDGSAENAVPEWNRQSLSLYTEKEVGHLAVATFEVFPNEFISFMSSDPHLEQTGTGHSVRIVRHAGSGEFRSDKILTIPSVDCGGQVACFGLIGAVPPNEGEIVGLVRLWPLNEGRLVWLRQSDGAYIRNVRLESPPDRKFAGVTRNADGTLMVYAVEAANNGIWIQRRSADGLNILYERRYRKGPYAQFKYRFSPIGVLAYSRPSTTNLLFEVTEASPLNEFDSNYPFNVEIDIATGGVVRATAYRSLLRQQNYFRVGAAYRSPAGELFLAGNSHGQAESVGDNRGYWLWRLREDGTVMWFSGFSLPESTGYTIQGPVALRSIGNSLLILSQLSRTGTLFGGMNWREVDGLLARHAITGNSYGAPIWSVVLRKDYDVHRCCPPQLWDIRSTIPRSLSLLGSSHALVTGGTSSSTDAHVRTYGALRDPAKTWLPVYPGLDVWKVRFDGARPESTDLVPYSFSMPVVIVETLDGAP
jgi:hypothetical protein